ncbi:MAG: YidB family protein [Roseimicrobium sp.]
MGLFDDLGKQVLGNVFGGTAEGQTNWVQLGIALLDKFGGIDGLVKQFTDRGFGNLIASWVSTGQNLPISAEQILQVLGQANVQQVATQAGTDANTAASGLASVLPGLIDKLTPNGQSVSGDLLAQGIQGLLSGKLGDLGKLFG